MLAAMSNPDGVAAAPPPRGARTVPALSYFFPRRHDEAENIEALVAEALAALPALADASRSSPSTTAAATAPGRWPTAWPRSTPTSCVSCTTR